MGPGTFVQRSTTLIDIISRLPLILAQKAVELPFTSSAQNRHTSSSVQAVKLRLKNRSQSGLAQTVPKGSKVVALPVPETVLLTSTHYTDAPAHLASLFPGTSTYGGILEELKRNIFTAGIDEVRIFESGFGFALATRFEVTEQNGVPLPDGARFLSHRAQGKRLRGYYITVDAHPTPTARVSTKNPQDLFTTKYGFTSLPSEMKQIPVEPGTSVKVFVLEFESKSGVSRQVQNQECPSSALAHMAQSGLVR